MDSLLSSAIQLIRIVVNITQQVDHNRCSAISLGERCQRLTPTLQTLQTHQLYPPNSESLLKNVVELLKEIEIFLKIFIKPSTGMSDIALWYGMLMKDHRSHTDSFQEFQDRLDRSLADLGFGVMVNVNQNVSEIRLQDCQNLRNDLENLSADLNTFRANLFCSPSYTEVVRQFGNQLQDYQSQLHNMIGEWDEKALEILSLRDILAEVLPHLQKQSGVTPDSQRIRNELTDIRRVLDDLRHESCLYPQQLMLIDSLSSSLIDEIAQLREPIQQQFHSEFHNLEILTKKFQSEYLQKSDEIVRSLQRLEFTDRDRIIREAKLSTLMIYQNQITISLDAPLGNGTFSEVKGGRYGNRNVAVKIIKSSTAFRDVEKQNIENEILLMSVCSFPSILQIYGYCQVDSCTVYLVLELCSYGSLWSYVQDKVKHPTIAFCLSIAWLSDVFSALRYLHDRKIIHGDVKAENVLLSEGLYCKLTDFGLSKQQMASTLGRQSSSAGTLLFMAPEVRNDHVWSHRSDVYSAGVMAYQILKREHPPHQRTRNMVMNYFKSIFPESLKNLLLSCIEEDRKKRMSSEEVSDMISQVQVSMEYLQDPREVHFTVRKCSVRNNMYH